MSFTALGVDRAIWLTVLNRGWSLIAGPATLIFIVAYLSPVEQGFYYAFAGVLGLQIFFELGLGFVVMQTVSHLMVDLRIDRGRWLGDGAALARIGRLLADVIHWYGVACVAFILIVTIAGFWFLGRSPGSAQVGWQLPWLLVVPVFGLSILANACYSFLEGAGLMADVALGRLLQNMVGLIALWAMFALGAKLMALVALHAVSLTIALLWIRSRHGALLRSAWRARAPAGVIDWRHEIWPFQWRIAVSWTAGYFGSQAITLILFDRLGPVDAGRFGLSLTALGAVATGASAWLSTKSPRFGGMVAQRRYAELDGLYAQAWRGSIGFGLAGVLVVLTVVSLMVAAGLPMGQRFVPLWGLVAMASATLISIKVNAEATYLRAFRREPYLRLSIVNGLGQATVAAMLAATGGVLSVTLGYAVVSIMIGLGWAHPLFIRLRQQYTGPGAA